tara:strand:- start:123 stop:428 length:306 start_codon:yes stop_codon:yes gene_type:complete
MPKYNLTNDQFGEIIQQYVEIVVDNMDRKTMEEWITDELIFQYGKLTDSELKERVDCHDENLFDELVDNVTQQYPKQDVNNTTHTYSLNVNESISFPVHKK